MRIGHLVRCIAYQLRLMLIHAFLSSDFNDGVIKGAEVAEQIWVRLQEAYCLD